MLTPFEIMWLLGLVVIYFVPTFVAMARQHHAVSVFLTNLFLGWTVIGWIVALVLALTRRRELQTG